MSATNARFFTALTGPTSPSPPTELQNSSSTCHPTLPKSNDLTFVYAYNDTGTPSGSEGIAMILGLNIALTVFWSPDGEAEGALGEPDAHMSCLWPVGDTAVSKVIDGGVRAGRPAVDWTMGFIGLVVFCLM
ncbi:hypothetical protein K458DRAFT_424417, partial [Lentithecium fluviatile CBS 122367]